MIKQPDLVDSNTEGEDSMVEKSPPSIKVGTKNRGTRSVASLTPEQLARKRANDREAQRSIRLRTKARIADLEQRIRELSGEPDDRVLEAIFKRNSELEEELKHLRHLRDTLGRPENRVSSSPESILVQGGLGTWDDQQHHMVYVPHWNPRVSGHESTEISASFYANGNSGLSGQAPPPQMPIPSTVPSRGLNTYPRRSDSGRSKTYSRSAGRNSPIQHSTSQGSQHENNNAISFTSHPTDCSLPFNHTTNTGVNFLGVDSSPPRIDSPTPSYNISSNNLPFLPHLQATLCPWELTLPFNPSTDSIESTLLEIIQRLKTLTSGNKQQVLKKPWRPCIKALVNPESSDDAQSIDTALSNVITRMSLRSLREKVGFLYIVHRFLEWQATLDEDTWNNLPQWMRPEPVQLSNRHPILASLILWPSIRKETIESQSRYFSHLQTENQNQNTFISSFSTSYTNSLILSWPYADTDIFYLSDTGDGALYVSDAFITHAQDLSNWSLDSNFWASWPDLMSAWVGSQLA